MGRAGLPLGDREAPRPCPGGCEPPPTVSGSGPRPVCVVSVSRAAPHRKRCPWRHPCPSRGLGCARHSRAHKGTAAGTSSAVAWPSPGAPLGPAGGTGCLSRPWAACPAWPGPKFPFQRWAAPPSAPSSRDARGVGRLDRRGPGCSQEILAPCGPPTAPGQVQGTVSQESGGGGGASLPSHAVPPAGLARGRWLSPEWWFSEPPSDIWRWSERGLLPAVPVPGLTFHIASPAPLLSQLPPLGGASGLTPFPRGGSEPRAECRATPGRQPEPLGLGCIHAASPGFQIRVRLGPSSCGRRKLRPRSAAHSLDAKLPPPLAGCGPWTR